MEIRILSAGKEIGPYSESQVRQYLSEGLISASDPAYTEGMTEWEPTEQLLARFAPSEVMAETEPPRSVSVRATGSTRGKRGPIVLQPLAAGEAPKRSRTGPTALTIEAPRPTTLLPPVAKFVRREERKQTKTAVQTDQLAPAHFFERQPVETAPAAPNAPTTPPEPEENLLAVEDRMPEPVPDVPPLPEPAVKQTALEEEHEQEHEQEHAPEPRSTIWYLSIAAACVGVLLLTALAYWVWQFSKPAPHSQTTLTPLPTGPIDVVAPPPVPQAAVDFSARGFAKEKKGDLDGALADYNKALAIDPHNIEALSRRALAYRDKGDWNHALADYNTVLTLAPDNADAYSNRGYLRQTQGDLDGALADYTEALSRRPTSAEAFFNVGLIKVRRGDIDGGIEAFNKAIELNPKLARAYYNRGDAKNTEGFTDGAIADYTQAIELEPTNAMAYLHRGTVRQNKGDAGGALADFSQAIANDPNLSPAYRGRSEIELQRGELTLAPVDCSKALELDPNDAQSQFNRGLAELGLHNLDRALADFSKYCEKAPRGSDCDSARLYLWSITAQQGSRDKADEELNYAVTNNWNAPPEDLLSKIANYLLGHVSEDDLVKDASSPDPSLEPARFCRIWYFAGMKSLVSGDATTAATDFQKSLATSQKDCREYLFAQAQLVSLGQARQASTQPPPPEP